MAEKFAIVILALILALTVAGVYWFMSTDGQMFYPKTETAQIIPTPAVDTPPAVEISTTSTKPMPTEEQIQAEIVNLGEKLKVEAKDRRFNSRELEYIVNPRKAAIKSLTN